MFILSICSKQKLYKFIVKLLLRYAVSLQSSSSDAKKAENKSIQGDELENKSTHIKEKWKLNLK